MQIIGMIFNILIVILALCSVVFAFFHRIKNKGNCCGEKCEKCNKECNKE